MSGAERSQKWRARRKAGLIRLDRHFGPWLPELLRLENYLDGMTEDDPEAVGEAVEQLLRDLAATRHGMTFDDVP